MKKWLRRGLIAALLAGLTLAVLYEAATHVGRGWLRGEAFYEGRPTSWWADQLDGWIERFDAPEDAEAWFDRMQIDDHGISVSMSIGAGTPPWPRPPEPWIDRILRRPIRVNDKNGLAPKVLWGWPGTESVLQELVIDARYARVAKCGLANVPLVQKIQWRKGE